jgi:16S rRNA processing protein RimM
MIMSVLTDFPERLVPGFQVFTEKNHQPVSIRSIRWHGADMLISFDEFRDRETVGVLRNQALMVRVENLPPLPEGDIYIHEFIGLTVIDDDTGTCLGEIQEIIETGANDVFIVRGSNGSELLIPDIDEVVRAIDMDRKEIRIHLLPGLV